MSFNAEDMQMTAGRTGFRPQIQKGGDVQARAKTQFSDGESRAVPPALRQVAAIEKDGARFSQSVFLGKIDVAIEGRAKNAVLPDDRGVGRGGLHGLYWPGAGGLRNCRLRYLGAGADGAASTVAPGVEAATAPVIGADAVGSAGLLHAEGPSAASQRVAVTRARFMQSILTGLIGL